jgi:ParB/RepB/Spo0J family partition protein
MPKLRSTPPAPLQTASLQLNAIAIPDTPDRFRPGGESIDELASSIEKHGLLQPILVTPAPDPDTYLLIAGHRRLLAVARLGRTTIEARILQLPTSAVDAVRLTENVQREDLSPLEEGVALLRWREKDRLTQESAAELIGKGLSWVKKREALTKLPDDLMTCLHQGLISPSVALELARVDDETARSVYLQTAVTYGATQDVASAWVANWLKDGSTPSGPDLAASAANYAGAGAGHKLNCHVCDRPFAISDLHNIFVCTPDLEALASAAHQ